MAPMRILPGILVLLLFSCSASNKLNEIPANGAWNIERSDTTFCDLNGKKENIDNLVIRVTGTYRTDSRHYEYIEDPRCTGYNTIGRIDLGGAHDRSVDKLDKVTVDTCAKRKQRLICIISAEIDAVVTVKVRPEGGIGIELLKINSFTVHDE